MDFLAEEPKVPEGLAGQRMIMLPPNVREQATTNPLIQHVYLTAIGFYPHATYHNTTRQRGSQEYVLLYCVGGEGFITLDRKEFNLTLNHYVILPPCKPYHYRSSQRNPWSIYWVHFTGTGSKILYDRYCGQSHLRARAVPYDEQRLVSFTQAMDTLESSFDEMSLEVANVSLLHFLITLIYQSNAASFLTNGDLIKDSIAFLRANLQSTFSISQLAAQHHLSVSRYSELFKQRTGYSPMKYFNHLKVQKSCQYLYFTNLSIQEISMKVGFDDPYYFSRLFKKQIGLAPSQYRARYKNTGTFLHQK